MPASISLPSAGASYRAVAVLAGSGARFGMGFILCLCSVLIAFSTVLFVQMQTPLQAVAIAPAVDPNARYYPLVSNWRFRMPRRFWFSVEVRLPEPDPEDLPTIDLALKVPLYPAATSPMPAPAVEAPADAFPPVQMQP